MTPSAHEPAVLADDPFDPARILDPYPFLARLRRCRTRLLARVHGSYAVAGYEEVYEVLTDFETYCSSGRPGPRDIRKDAGWRPPASWNRTRPSTP